MKKQVLFALGACYALCYPISAQNTVASSEFRDTLILTRNNTMKILFIGPSMETMKKYGRADSLKNYFLSDLTKAKQQASYPAESRVTHYIVHPNGKRRLKSESEDYQEPAIDVAKEVRAMDLNLPAYAYIIHDIAANAELQIYLSSPSEISELERTDLTRAIHTIAAGKRSSRRYSNIELKEENGVWVRKMAGRKKANAFEVNSLFGAALIGNQLSPELGTQISYVANDKHSVPVFKAGFLLTYCVFTEYANKEFDNFYGVSSYNITLMMRDGNSAQRWVGFELGRMDADGGYLDGNYKLGLIYSVKSLQVGLHLLSQRPMTNAANENVLLGFTVRACL